MKNKDYWLKRKIERNKRSIKEEEELLKMIYKLLEECYEATMDNIYKFYGKFATEEGITIAEAQKLLSPIELKECANRIKRLVEVAGKIDTSTPFGKARNKQIEREIRILRGRGRITREQLLNDAINEEWIKTALKMDEELGKLLEKQYERAFKEGLEDAGVKTTKLPINTIESAILIPKFAYHFSDTIWKNKDKLIVFINTELRKGIVQGIDVRKTTKKLQDTMDVQKYQAKRLVVTETQVAQQEGALEGYRKSGVVEKVRIISAGDKKVCGVCEENDDTIIPLDEAVVGDNICPFHPICRCTVVPYFEKE